MRRIAAVLVLTLFGLQGCSWIKSWGGDDDPGDPAPLVEFEESLKVRKIWKTSIGDGMGKQGLSMAPVYSSGVLYAADYEGRLAAVDAESGRMKWVLKTKQAFSGGPGLDGEHLYMRSQVFDLESGAVVQTASDSRVDLILGEPDASPPVPQYGTAVGRATPAASSGAGGGVVDRCTDCGCRLFRRHAAPGH